MKKPAFLLLALVIMAGAVALSGGGRDGKTDTPPAFQVERGAANPFTHLRVPFEPSDFQFAIVSDRTGGHRAGVFSRAIEKVNLMQPEFVVSVGDLIETAKEEKTLVKHWGEFDGFLGKLTMPFFYVAGNHDISNADSERFWKEKLGRRYYHFLYRDVLFLILNSEDPPGSANLGKEQVAWATKTLADNAKVRWTVVFVHRPLWTDAAKTHFGEVEKALADRPYTVFCGHVHRFQKFVRQGRNYYQLATTGGVSRLRGVDMGEFDHITWVTMKKTGPVLAHVLLDAIVPEDMKPIESAEKGTAAKKLPTHPVRGMVYFDGVPLVNASVVFEPTGEKAKNSRRADALTSADGSFLLGTYGREDGATEGEFAVTVTGRKGTPVPGRYAKGDTSGLRATIRAGENVVRFELTK